jgi:hypothetical protein
MNQKIFKYSFILSIGLLFEWWLIWYSPLTIPELIPMTPIKIDGLLLGGLLLTVLIFAQKRFLQANPDTTILKLTIYGTSICFFAEFIFQGLRQFFISADTLNERIHYFFLGTIAVSIFGAVLSFLISFQLKTKKTGQLILLIITFIIAFNIFKHFFP